MRAVLDVNVIVSAIIAPQGTPRQVLAAWEHQLFSSITSDGIIAEVQEKLRDREIGGSYGVTAEDIRWVSALLRTQAEIAAVAFHEVIQVTGDPEDDYVLATAVLGKADYLVTGDRGLLALKEHRGVEILNPRAFLNLLAN
ncbi:MAG: putative toxin-antitoxin system toxin component, PIN family [Candidatus Marsarchaeota archaeon]|nr:putative toxin-antitoxin system toxin component, PIN family [Candidatus Marsarchaeota archaeon]